MGQHDHPQSPGDLPTTWRQRAEFLSEYGDPNTARFWELAATELEQALRTLGAETLTLVEASAMCGYSADHLGFLVRTGKIPNYGRKNAPRIRRADLPTKTPRSAGRLPTRNKAGVDHDIANLDITRLK